MDEKFRDLIPDKDGFLKEYESYDGSKILYEREVA